MKKINTLQKIKNLLIESNSNNEIIDKIETLLTSWVDSNECIIAYTRGELDAILERDATDKEWDTCWDSIHNNDTMWSYVSDACNEAEEEALNCDECDGEKYIDVNPEQSYEYKPCPSCNDFEE